MRPFECNRCHARSYNEKMPKSCGTCGFDKLSELQSLCLLLPVEIEPKFPIVHTSGEIQSDDGGVASVVGQQWVTACKAIEKPPLCTAEPSACTCYRCLKWIEKRTAELKASSSLPETVAVQPSDNVIGEFEGFDDEPLPSEDAALADIDFSEPDVLPSNGE